MISRFIIYGFFGWGIEVLWTGIESLIQRRHGAERFIFVMDVSDIWHGNIFRTHNGFIEINVVVFERGDIYALYFYL